MTQIVRCHGKILGRDLGLEIVAEVEEEIMAQEDKTRCQNKMLSGNYQLNNKHHVNSDESNH